MDTIRLSLALPVLMLAACSHPPAVDTDELQKRVADAEARATAAEKRAANAEAVSRQQQAAAAAMPPQADQVGPPEIANVDGNTNGGFGQPMNDTNPIEPQPANGAPPSQ
jgi:hypothetical protein